MHNTFRGAWRHRQWRWLLASYTVSSVGDFFYFVALVVFLIEATGSATWIAAAAVGRLLTYALLGSVGGVIADRYDRRRLMIVLDLARAAIMAVLAVVAWLNGPPLLAIALIMLNSAASTPYRAAIVAATPTTVDEEDLAAANAAESIVGQVALFIGPAIGGLVVAVAGSGTAFMANGLTFVASGLLLLRLGSVGGGLPVGDDDGDGGMIDQLRDGLRTMRAEQGLVALTAFASTAVFLYGFEEVVQVLVATDRLALDAAAVGLLGAAVGVGGLLVAPFTARLGSGASAGRMLAASGVLMGAPIAVLAVVSNTIVAVAVLMIEGVGIIVHEVLFITLLQRSTPEDRLARVYGLQDSITAVAQLSGSLAAPILIAVTSLETALVVGGSIVVTASIALAGRLDRLARRLEPARLANAPTVELLSRLSIFADAPGAAVERLARAAVPQRICSGVTVFEQGDEPDDLYIVVGGTAAVVRDGVEIEQIGADGWFGEVGLIRHLDRNASVIAVDDLDVLAIPGTVFLDALALNELLPDPLRLSLAARSPGHPRSATLSE